VHEPAPTLADNKSDRINYSFLNYPLSETIIVLGSNALAAVVVNICRRLN